ncbi:MAG: helicase HerA-like domain-containing protein, partial [Candidatus Altiarchaeota archaeon]
MNNRFKIILFLLAILGALSTNVSAQIFPRVDDYYFPPNSQYGASVPIYANASDDVAINESWIQIIHPNATAINYSMEIINVYFPTQKRYRRVFDSLPIGINNFTIYTNDSAGNINSVRPNFLVRIYTLPSPNPFPRIDSSYISSVESPNHVSIEVNASDYLYVESVVARITHPNSTVVDYPLTLVEEINRTTNRFNTTISNLPVGDHNVVFIVNDTHGRLNNATASLFEVYTLGAFSGDILDAGGNPVVTTFNLYRPGTRDLIHSFSTNAQGVYSQSIRQRVYDVELEFANRTFMIRNVNLSGVADPIDIDLVSRTETDLDNDIKGFAVSTQFNQAGELTINYTQSEVGVNEGKLRIFVCTNWTFSTRRCLTDWAELPGTVDKIRNRVNGTFSNLTTDGPRAYMVAEGTNPYKWTVVPESIDETVFLGTTGTLTQLNITNQGYYDIIFNLSVQGPASNFLYVTLSTNLITILGNRSEVVTIYYDAPDTAAYYVNIGEIVVRPTNVPAIADQYATSKAIPINLNVVREDIIPPTIRLISPANDSSMVAGTIIDFEVSDLNISQVQYRLNNGPLLTLSSPYDIDTTGYSEGTFTVQIQALDSSQNSANKTYRFTIDNSLVDNTAPVITVNSPVNLSTIIPGTIIDLSVTDPNLFFVNYSVNGGSSTTLLNPYDIDSGGFGDGVTTIIVNAIDSRSNLATVTLIYIVDSSLTDFTSPVISLISPLNNTQMPIGSTIDFSVSDDHLTSVNYSINNLPAQPLSSPFDIDTSTWLEGTYIIRVNAADTNGNTATSTYQFSLVLTNVSLYLSSLSINDINPGGTILVAVSIDSDTSIDDVSVAIDLPDGSSVTYPMLGIGNLYSISIAGFATLGDYFVVVTANNTGGDTATRSTCFEVYTDWTFSGDVLNSQGQVIPTNFTLTRSGCHEVAQTFSTDSNGDYSAVVRNKVYNLTIDVIDGQMRLYNIDFATIADDPLDLEKLAGINLYLPNATGLSGYAVNHSISISTGRIYLRYDEDDIVNNENFVFLLGCSDWNWTARECTNNFSIVPSAVLDIYTNTMRVDVTNLTTLFLAESLSCGDSVCQLTYGENCYTCPDDCGLCETNVSINITINQTSIGGGGGSRVNLGPIEELLEQITGNITLMDQRMALIEEYLSRLNLTISPTTLQAIGDMIGSQTEKLDLIFLSQQISQLIYGSQIVSAELYPGEYTQTQIHLKNSLNEIIDLEVNVSGGIADFVTPELRTFNLKPSEDIDITIIVYIPPGTNPGTYYGDITIHGKDIVSRIPVNIRVLSPLTKLIDFKIQLVSDVVRPGEEIRAEEIFYNLGEFGQIEVTAVLELLDENDNVVNRREDTLTVETSQNIIKTLRVPEDAQEDKRYIIQGTAYYSGLNNETLRTNAIAYVTIHTPLLLRKYYGVPLWAYLLIIISAILAYSLNLYNKQRIASRRRYLETIDYKTLPPLIDRSGFIGKLAETDIRTFIKLDDLTTHTLIAGATGSGKTIAAQDIAEEALKKGISVIVFDPTAQWTGFLRPNKDKIMLQSYRSFDIKQSEAKAFDGNIVTINDPTQQIDLKRYMNPGEITVFCLNSLDPKEIDVFVENTVKTIFKAELAESQNLKMILVYDEVHRLLPKFGGSGRGFTQIERAAREFRKWGLGLTLIS